MRRLSDILQDWLDTQEELMLYLNQAGLLKEQEENFLDLIGATHEEVPKMVQGSKFQSR